MLINKREFNNFKAPAHAHGREFMWLGLYNDGDYISEFDLKYRKENSFYTIQQQKLLTFGLMGHGNFFYYSTHNGQFNLNDKKIQVLYKVGDQVYTLTDAPNTTYNQKPISFKSAESFFNPFGEQTEGTLKPFIYEYSVGYKQKLEYNNNVTIWFQPVLNVPMKQNEPLYMTIRLVSNQNLNGELIILSNGVPKLHEKAPLQIKQAGQMNWVVR